MMNEIDKRIALCQRLQKLGFAARRTVKLYGEEFDLLSDPTPAGAGYHVKGVSRKSGSVRHIGIPLSVVRTIEHELHVMEQTVIAA